MILSCQNICKAFGEKVILNDASFHIEDREKAALIGCNGAGKTTLIKEFIKDKNALFFLGDTQTEYNQINSMKNTIAEYYNDNFIKNISINIWEVFRMNYPFG